MNRFSNPVLLVIAVLATALCLAADDTPTTAKPTVLVIGDSLSAAYGIRAEESWVNLLQERLGSAYEVVNASISGDTTGGGLARIGKTLATHEPDIVIIELGGNDGLRGLPIETIRNNLKAMAEAVVAVEAQPVLAGMLMPPNLGAPLYRGLPARLRGSGRSHRRRALVPFLLEGVALSEEGLMQDDGGTPHSGGAGTTARQRVAGVGTIGREATARDHSLIPSSCMIVGTPAVYTHMAWPPIRATGHRACAAYIGLPIIDFDSWSAPGAHQRRCHHNHHRRAEVTKTR